MFEKGKPGCCDEDERVILEKAKAIVEGTQKAVEALVNEVIEYRDCAQKKLEIASDVFKETRGRAALKAYAAAELAEQQQQAEAVAEAEAEAAGQSPSNKRKRDEEATRFSTRIRHRNATNTNTP